MARTDSERYDDTIKYIKGHVSAKLAQDIRTKTQSQKMKIGALLSLKSHWYGISGSANQHWAVRSLVLCQHTYLQGHGLCQDLATTKRHFKGKVESAVKKALDSYTVSDRKTIVALGEAAAKTMGTAGAFNYYTRTRDDMSLGTGAVVCFNAVKLWLFKAGFVSLQWLAADKLTAVTANNVLGDGVVIDPDQLPNMPRGYIFNFHDARMKQVCHWGISLGDGWAAASNTTENWAGARNPVEFRKGNSVYGEFKLVESYEVCKQKYKEHGEQAKEITIRQINPTQSPLRS